MKIRRIWARPNKDTFKIKPIKDLVYWYFKNDQVWIDPFCGYFSPCKMEYKNDLNPKVPAGSHKRALDFLKSFETNSIDGILFDPPYSITQLKRSYESIGIDFKNSDGQAFGRWVLEKEEIDRILKPGGIVIFFGWSTSWLGKARGYEIKELLIVPHGPARYDTLVTVEEKNAIL